MSVWFVLVLLLCVCISLTGEEYDSQYDSHREDCNCDDCQYWEKEFKKDPYWN